jgi:hypothetical protein
MHADRRTFIKASVVGMAGRRSTPTSAQRRMNWEYSSETKPFDEEETTMKTIESRLET